MKGNKKYIGLKWTRLVGSFSSKKEEIRVAWGVCYLKEKKVKEDSSSRTRIGTLLKTGKKKVAAAVGVC